MITLEEAAGARDKARSQRHETLKRLESLVRDTNVMHLICTLQNAEYSWGFYDAALDILRANKAVGFEDGKLVGAT